MTKFFQFSGTISGTTYFLRMLFTILLVIPGIILLFSFFGSYMMNEGFIDMNNPEGFDQLAFQEKIEDNPEEFFGNLWSSVSSGWIISIIIAFLPALWFSLASYYKRISALFYKNRNNIFAIFIGYEIIADLTQFGILDSISFLNTPFSIISTLIFLFLIFKNSDTDKDDHEG